MNEFDKQVNEMIKKEKEKAEGDLQRLSELAHVLDIHGKNVDAVLEFARLFTQLEKEKIITKKAFCEVTNSEEEPERRLQIELTESEAKTLDLCLRASEIDAAGMVAAGFNGQKTRLSNIKSLERKLQKARTNEPAKEIDEDYGR